jgi:hypothetical protein
MALQFLCRTGLNGFINPDVEVENIGYFLDVYTVYENDLFFH